MGGIEPKREVALFAALCSAVLAWGCGNSDSGETATEHGGNHAGHEGGTHGPKSDEATGDGGGHKAHGGRSDHGSRTVKLSADALKRIDIQTAQVTRGNLEDTAIAPATIEHDVDRVAHITPLVEGQIIDLRATLGDQVESGQTLAVIRSVALGDARAALSEATAAREVAKANFRRQRTLRDEGIASEREFLEAKGELRKAEARYESAVSKLKTFGVRGGQGARYPLRSHIDGTIIEQHATMGETKGPGDALFVVADQSKVWVIGRVYERDVSKLELGMSARVRLDAYPDRSWKGTVDWMANTVDEKTRNLPVRVVLDNEKGLLRPGLFGTLILAPESGPDAPALVPVDAAQKLGGKDVVFVPGDERGHFRAVEVQLGAEARRLVEITDGVEPGQRVVTKGAFDLKAAATASTRRAAHHH